MTKAVPGARWLAALLGAAVVLVAGGTPALAEVTNQPPVAVAPLSVYQALDDETLTVAAPGVLGNDTDPEGDTLTAVLVSPPETGTFTLKADGSFTYVPVRGQVAFVDFTYRAKDDSGALSAPVTESIIVYVPGPIAVADSYTTPADVTLKKGLQSGVLSNDIYGGGSFEYQLGFLTAALKDAPKLGTVTLAKDGSFVYVPNGTVGVDTFTYVTKGAYAGRPEGVGTVTITLTTPNRAPVAVVDAYSTPEDTSLTVGATGVLSNDTDADGDTVSAVLVAGPAHGTLTLNANGSFTYVPALNYNGADSFTYQAKDPKGLLSSVATVALTVTAVNDAPQAVADLSSTAEDSVLTLPAPGVLGNDTDVDGDGLTASLASSPSHGSVSVNADGSFRYVPTADYSGADEFRYTVDDGHGGTGTTTVSLTVTPVNDAPTVTVVAGGSCGVDDRSGTVTLSVADVDSPVAGLTVTATSSNPALVPNNQITFAGSGTGRTMGVATVPGRTGTAVVTVTVSDGTTTSTVPVTVQAAGTGSDTVVGTDGADILFGQNGNDSLSGLGGNDLLCGGSGNDVLNGGSGDDVVSGGSGSDQLTGGSGADRFNGGTGTDSATDVRAADGDVQDGSVP